MEFSDWLRQKMKQRQINNAELARRSEVTTGQISRVVTGSRGAGPELCIAIATGLNLPREEVFRARGWLVDVEAPAFKLNKETEELAKEIDTLPSVSRKVALQVAKATVKALREQSDE